MILFCGHLHHPHLGRRDFFMTNLGIGPFCKSMHRRLDKPVGLLLDWPIVHCNS